MVFDVLVTGAGGRVGAALCRHLGEDPAYRLTTLDLDPLDDETLVADTRDYEAIRPAFDDKDVVVHLAVSPALGRASDDVGWADALAGELESVTNAYHAAVEADVETFVYPSSHQLVEAYVEEAPDPRSPEFCLDHTVPIRPTSQYALAKAWGEAYGRFAAEVHGLRVYALRIGWVQVGGAEHPYAAAEAAVDAGDVERDSPAYHDIADRPIWLSGRDAAHLVDCCVRDRTVTYDVFFGCSDNTGCWLDLDRARTVLGYDPVDDVADWSGPP